MDGSYERLESMEVVVLLRVDMLYQLKEKRGTTVDDSACKRIRT